MASVGRWPPGPPGVRGAGPARLSTVPGPQRRGVLGAPRPPGVGAGAAGCHALPARRPGCACRAITEMAPISSDCWKPAHELSQRGRRVSHQHAVTTPHGTRHEGVLARLPGAQRRCRGTQVDGDPFPAGSGQGQVLPCAGAVPASCGSPLVLQPRRELWARGQAAVASSHLHSQLGAHPSLPTQKKRHQSIHHPCARSPRSGLPASAGRRPGSRLSHSQAGQGDRCCCHGAGLRHVRGDSSTLRSQGGHPGPPSPIIPAQSSQPSPPSLCPSLSLPAAPGKMLMGCRARPGLMAGLCKGEEGAVPRACCSRPGSLLPSSCSSCLTPALHLLGRLACGSLAMAPWSSAAGWARGGHRALVATPSCHPTQPQQARPLVQGDWEPAQCPPWAGTEVGVRAGNPAWSSRGRGVALPAHGLPVFPRTTWTLCSPTTV